MRDQEIIGLWEAYQQVYTQPEEVEQLDEAMSSYDRNRQRAAQRAAARNAARDAGKTGNVPGVGYVSPRRERETYTDESGQERHKSGARMPKEENQNQSFDLFDVIKGHLLDEGYADTEQAALAIMSNMSEEWKQSIIEGVGGYDDPILGPHTPGGKLVRGGVEAAKKVVTGVVKGVGSEFAKPAPQPPGGLTPMQRLQRRPDPTIR